MGQTYSAGQMIDQLAVRTANNIGVASLLTIRSQYLYYINRGLRYWDSQGSYTFNAKMETFIVGPSVFTFPFSSLSATIDPGKDIYLYMSATQSGNIPQPTSTPYPVRRVPLNEYAARGVMPPQKANTSNIYDHYVISGTNFLFYPPLTGATNMTIIYHISTVPLTDSYSVFTKYPDDFDDVILDWAEAEVKRVYRIVGWDTLLARVMEQGKMLVDQYRTTTDVSGGQSNALRDMQDQKIRSQT